MVEEASEKLKREQKKKENDKIKTEIIPVESESDDSEVELDEELVSLKKEIIPVESESDDSEVELDEELVSLKKAIIPVLYRHLFLSLLSSSVLSFHSISPS
jgi:seryl-tRNA synthetase